jgi:hypothetical protein
MRLALAAVILAVTLAGTAEAQTTGRDWMQWDSANRAIYIMGYFETINAVANAYGGEVRTKEKERLTYIQAAEIIYRKLLNEPEIRSGPMTEIAGTALAPYITVTDRSGRPYQAPTGAPK